MEVGHINNFKKSKHKQKTEKTKALKIRQTNSTFDPYEVLRFEAILVKCNKLLSIAKLENICKFFLHNNKESTGVWSSVLGEIPELLKNYTGIIA